MANLTTRITVGLNASMRLREQGNRIMTGSDQSQNSSTKSQPNQSDPYICHRKSDYVPTTTGVNKRGLMTTSRERLGMALEYVRKRPNYVAKHLRRSITQIDSNEQETRSEEPEYIVHFNDGTAVGMRSLERDDKNRHAYRKRIKHNNLKVLQVVIDISKDIIRCVQDILIQIAWHASNLFGETLHRFGKVRQNGEARAKYRHMKNCRPSFGCG